MLFKKVQKMCWLIENKGGITFNISWKLCVNTANETSLSWSSATVRCDYSPLKPLDHECKSDKQRQYELCANVPKTKPKNNKRQFGHKGNMHQLSSDSKTTEKNQPSTKQKQHKDQPRNPQPNKKNTHTIKKQSIQFVYLLALKHIKNI